MIRRVAVKLAVTFTNILTFAVAWVVAYAVVFRFLHGALALGHVAPGYEPPFTWYQGFVLSLCIVFVVFGGLTRIWARHILSVALASASIALLGMIALAASMYLADRGDPSIIWPYIRPGPRELLGTLFSSGAAAFGWYIASRLRRHPTPTPSGRGLA